MDELGQVFDSSHLDSVGGETKVRNQDTETPQTTLPADDTSAEGLSKVVSADSSSSVQSLNTLNEGDGRKYEDVTAQTQKEPHNKQGGSASASWPGSSLTGWFGLTAVEKPDSITEEEEHGENQPEASFTSTMTGWLGLGGQEKPALDDSVNADSLASTMTGWLGFGGKEKTDQMSERELHTEKDSASEEEPTEKYRSRRMSMNIEDTQKEMEGTTTLEWLGNGLSHRFGLSLSNQESEHMEPTLKDPKETKKEEEQPSSWFDMGIKDILAFNKGKIDVVGSTGSNVKKTEQSTGPENVNSGQSQPGMMEQVMAETNSLSEVAETQKDERQPPERDISSASADSGTGDSNGDDMHPGTSDSGKDRLSSEGLAYRDAQKDISTQSEVKSQAVGETSSIFNSLFYVGRNEGVQDNIIEDSQKNKVPVDGEESKDMKNKEHQIPNTIEVEENIRQPGEENATVSDQSSTSSDFLGPTAGEDGKRAGEEKAQTPDFKDHLDMFLTSPVREDKGHDAERTLPEYNYHTTQDQGSKGGIDDIVGTQPIISSGSAGEDREQVSNEDDNLTNQETTVALLMMDKVAEAHPGQSVKEGEMLQAGDITELIQSPHSADGSIRNMSVDVSEDDIGKRTQATEDDNMAGHKSESDAAMDAGATIDRKNSIDGDTIKGTALQTSVDLQTETKQMERDENTEDLMRREEVKPPDNHQAVKEVEQEEVTAMGNGIEGEETQGEGDEISKDKVVVQGAQTQKGKLKVEEEEEEVKKVEKQQLAFGTKEKKLEGKVQESKEDVTQAEKRVDEGQSSIYFTADAESIVQSETQSEGSSGISIQTENVDTKAPEDQEEGRHQEETVKSMKEEDSQENEMIESRDKPDCLMDRCSEAPANRDGNILGTERSSTHREETQTGEHHLPIEGDQDIAESLGGKDFESMEEEKGRKQVEQDRYDSAANAESTGNTSNVVKSTKDVSDTSKDLLYSSVTDDEQPVSAEVENTGHTEESTLQQGEKAKSDAEMANNSALEDHKMDTVEDSGKAEVLMTVEDDPASPNLAPEVKTEIVNQVVVEDESGGGLSLLRGAFGYFSQTPATELIQNLDSNAGEAQGSLTSDAELDSTDVNARGVMTVPSITPPQPTPQQVSQPSPPPIHTASPLHPPTTPSLPATTHHLRQTKGLSKHYNNLLTHMSVEEIGILLEHFGRHKLQFLDYICGRSEPMIEEVDHDESILLDVERLLHYHLDALKSPRTRMRDAPQEEKEKTRTLVALEKLQLLVTRVKEMFNRRKVDVRSAYQQGISYQIRSVLNHFTF